MNKRLLILFFLMTCLIFTLISCGEKEKNKPVSSVSSSSNFTPDNQNPNPPPVIDNEGCNHIFSSASVDTKTDSNYAISLKRKCNVCYKEITNEAISWVEAEEWRNAFSFENMKSFTLIHGVNNTDYSESITKKYKTVNNIYTEEYFISDPCENSEYYVNENLSGYKIMYSDFTYSPEKRAFVYQLNDTSYIEIMFADKKLLSISTVSLKNEIEEKSTFYYLNQGLINVSVPSYFFERYESMISVDSLKNAKVSSSDAEKINSLLGSIDFNSIRYEISYLENSVLGICFYFDQTLTDPIFNSTYDKITISAQHDIIKELTIGNNSYVFDWYL